MRKRKTKRTNSQSMAEMSMEWDLFHDKESEKVWENSIFSNKSINCNLGSTCNYPVCHHHTLNDYIWATVTVLFMTFLIAIQN